MFISKAYRQDDMQPFPIKKLFLSKISSSRVC